MQDIVADSLYELQSGSRDQQLVTWAELAEFLVDQLVAE